MKEQHRRILRIAALLDVLVAFGFFAAIVLFGIGVPIFVPVVLAFSGVMLVAATLVVK